MTLRLPTVPTIACVQVLGNLGEESGGSNTWNGGLTLEASIDGVAFATLVRDDAAATASGFDQNYFVLESPMTRTACDADFINARLCDGSDYVSLAASGTSKPAA